MRLTRNRSAAVAALAAVALGLIVATPIAAATPTSLPSGEHMFGQASVEPAYNDMNGQILYVLTPLHAPLPVNSNNHSWAPFYIVVYPQNSTVGTLNCMGVPGNCPDHDGEIAGAATFLRPAIYGTNPATVLGHDHLLAPPASGGDFNIAWHVFVVLFNNVSFINDHITNLSHLNDALGDGEVSMFDSGIVFMCAVVPAVTYTHGTPA